MPELPEVETVRRGLARRMSGRRIVQAELRRPDLRRPFPPMLAERLDGALIGALARRGKYILIELDESGLLLLHLGMSGRIIAGDSNGADAKHDHVVLTLDDGTVVRLNDARGSSLRDYVQANGELGYFQHRWAVYGHEGEPCPGCTCAEGVRRITQAGRSTFFCAKKQR